MTTDLKAQFAAVAAQIEACEKSAALLRDRTIEAARAGHMPWTIANEIAQLNDQWSAALLSTLELARAIAVEPPTQNSG
jgi:hypothetical protein